MVWSTDGEPLRPTSSISATVLYEHGCRSLAYFSGVSFLTEETAVKSQKHSWIIPITSAGTAASRDRLLKAPFMSSHEVDGAFDPNYQAFFRTVRIKRAPIARCLISSSHFLTDSSQTRAVKAWAEKHPNELHFTTDMAFLN